MTSKTLRTTRALKIPSFQAEELSIELPSVSMDASVPPTPRSSVDSRQISPPSILKKPASATRQVSFKENHTVIPMTYYTETDDEEEVASPSFTPVADDNDEKSPPTTPKLETPTTPTPLMTAKQKLEGKRDHMPPGRPLSERFKRASRADLKRLRYDIQRLLNAKSIRLRHARRRLRLFESLVVAFSSTIGLLSAAMCFLVITSVLSKQAEISRKDRLLQILIPLMCLMVALLTGVLLKIYRFAPRLFMNNFASYDYQQASSLILNLSRFIADIDAAFEGTERILLLETATVVLTEALLTKAKYDGRDPTYLKIFRDCIIGPFICLAALTSSIVLLFVNQSLNAEQAGSEVGFCCCTPRQRKYLSKVYSRSEAPEIKNWSALVLPV